MDKEYFRHVRLQPWMGSQLSDRDTKSEDLDSPLRIARREESFAITVEKVKDYESH